MESTIKTLAKKRLGATKYTDMEDITTHTFSNKEGLNGEKCGDANHDPLLHPTSLDPTFSMNSQSSTPSHRMMVIGYFCLMT